MKTLLITIFTVALLLPQVSFAALQFDGVNDYIRVTNQTPFNFERTNPFSVCFWTTFTNANNEESLVGRLDPATSFRGWEVHKQESAFGNYIQMFLISTHPSNAIQQELNYTPPTNTWIHICFTYSGSSTAAGVTGYINGSVQSKRTPLLDSLSATTQNSIDLQFGRRNNGTLFHGGKVDDVRIYNRVLSANEIRGMYLSKSRYSGYDGLCSALKGHWLLQNNNFANDISGCSNHGNLVGGVASTISSPPFSRSRR